MTFNFGIRVEGTRMYFHLRLVSIAMALVFTGALVRYSGGLDFSLLDALLSGNPDTARKQPVKTVEPSPAPQKRVDAERTLSSGEFTFFETLADADLSKHAGLKGDIVHKSGDATRKPDPVIAERRKPAEAATAQGGISADDVDDAESAPPAELSAAASINDKPFGEEGGNKIAVQVNTFKEFDRAVDILKRLRIKGYPAFMRAEEASLHGGEVWYRVYLGRYPDHEKALAAIYRARAEERLNPLIVFEKE